MSESLLDKNTRLGPVHLNVADLDGEAAFYENALGLKVRQSSPTEVALGAGGREDLLVLHLLPQASHPRRRSAGLYHFCLAVEHRNELGWWLKRLLDKQIPLQGLVDHHMAEAIYLADPEGNGIELNWDRPRSKWKSPEFLVRHGNGPLDTEGLLQEAETHPIQELPSDARVGHIHLHVGDLGICENFYCAVLGLDKMMEFRGQAVFTSAGGYHHHIAFNIWHGVDAPPSPENSLGLEHFTLQLAGAEELAKVKVRMQAAGVEIKERSGGLLVHDPSGNALLLLA
ncbi:MAG: VOC family protein [candidate division FCPU426 bacterium]